MLISSLCSPFRHTTTMIPARSALGQITTRLADRGVSGPGAFYRNAGISTLKYVMPMVSPGFRG